MTRNRRPRDFEALGSLIEGLFKRKGLEKAIARQAALSQWPVIVGKTIASHATAVSISQGTLYVEVDSSTWMNELSAVKHTLLKRLNRAPRFAASPITDIRFRQRSGAGLKPRPIEKAHEPAAPSCEDMRVIDRALAPLKDDALKDALREMLVKDRALKKRRGEARGKTEVTSGA
jgi:hypothetical protein